MFSTDSNMPNAPIDVTGRIGQYSQGDEQCHHVAYLYDYAGAPYKTQAHIRQVMELYGNTADGLCGNDDCGQMSAWYVLSAMGFYAVDPTSGVYVIGSPLLDKATIRLDPKYYPGGTFTIQTTNNSAAQRLHPVGEVERPAVRPLLVFAGGTGQGRHARAQHGPAAQQEMGRGKVRTAADGFAVLGTKPLTGQRRLPPMRVRRERSCAV